MEQHKQEEISHYDNFAKYWWQNNKNNLDFKTDVHQLQHSLYSSYHWLEKWLQKECPNKKVLDYGCGTGIHTITPAIAGASQVIGIDLSEKSLKIAQKRVEKQGVEDTVTLLKMDCEHLEFPDNTFDIILDSGTFSSLDLDKALPELARVLKPNGKLIALETFGHNPLTNCKRMLNVKLGTRTKWAADHIFKKSDFTRIHKYFQTIEEHYFHLFALFMIPFHRIPGIPSIVKLVDKIDNFLLTKIPPLRKYAFKVIMILSNPKKQSYQYYGKTTM